MVTRIVKYDQRWRLHLSDLSCSVYLLDFDVEPVNEPVVDEAIVSEAVVGEAVVGEAIVRVAGQVGGGGEDVVVSNVREGHRGHRGGGCNSNWLNLSDLVDWSGSLQGSQTSSSGVLEGSSELSLGLGNILRVVQVGVGNLISLDIIVDRSQSSVVASNRCVK